jgi:Zn-dependent M28 family amino/carboxypeptidase
MKRTLWIYLLISVLAYSLTLAQTTLEDELYGFVIGMEGKTHLGRGEFIKDQLHKMDIGYVTAPFKKNLIQKQDTTVVEGENIIARIGSGEKRIVVGAHYDVAPNSPGANDNGSGVAVALGLIKYLKNIEWNYSVDFCFFDYEEMGSIGSAFYIRQFVIPKKHFAMINLDIEGSGEEIFVGPIGRNNRYLIQFVREAERQTGFPVVEGVEFPGSDHEAFNKFKLENISISIVPKGDAGRLTKFVHNGYKADSIDVPQVLAVMHTSDDRSIFISPAALKLSYEFTKTLLMLLNQARR